MFQIKQTIQGRQFTWWHGVLITLAVVSLSVSLATRVCELAVPHGVSVKAGVTEGMRQHMDRDAVAWVAPVARFVFLQPVTYYPKFAPTGPPLPTVLFEKSLYNRPPPSASVLA